MAKCPICKGDLICRTCASAPVKQSQEEGDGAVLPCAKDKCEATIYVRNAITKAGIPNVAVTLTGATGPPKTDANGFAIYKGLEPGEHTAKIVLTGLEKKFALPADALDTLTKTIAAGTESYFVFDLDPLGPLTVVVMRKDKPSVLVPAVKVTIAGATPTNTPVPDNQKTSDKGTVVFEGLRKDSYDLTISLDGKPATEYSIVDAPKQPYAFDPGADKNEAEFKIARMIYLRLKYKDPEGNPHVFPKDFTGSVVFNNGTKKEVKILDDAGNLEFAIEEAKTNFTLEFETAKVQYLVHKQEPPDTEWKLEAPIVEDPDDAALNALTVAGKRFFALPKKWSLAVTKWEATDVTLPADGKIVIPEGGIGTKTAPGVLTLLPTVQYARFEFYDRKYGHSNHGDKRIPIPAVTLKGARKATAPGAAEAPVAGTHDTISNWMIDAADTAKAAQALPWIITKTDAGADLPKLDKTMLLEFGWTDGFVHSTSATVRKIIEIPTGDAKRKPTKDRNLYYDLPKVWKSINYFTRFTDAVKSKFFDELAVTDVDISLVKTTPFIFSLDDIVLETSAGSQAVKDQKRNGDPVAMDKHSRLTLVYCDEADKLKPKVYDPRPKAQFHSKTEFQKLSTADTRRNYLTQYAANTRAVVFCSSFHDVYDKRTAGADYSKKEVMGARAARHNDDEISGRKSVDGFANASYVSAYTCNGAGFFDLHYLHYAATDGTTVFGLFITFWASRFFFQDDDACIPAGYTRDELFEVDDTTRGNGELSDKINYITEGMSNSMKRWNEKNYQLEELDDKTDIAIKTFCLFEAKEFEEPSGSGTFIDRGGVAQCDSALVKNVLGSWMGKRVARLRRSGYSDEGASWGSAAGTEARLQEFDGTTSPPRLALAHEIGHASGLDDDYIYYLDGFPGLVRYAQYFPGMPYKLDKSSLMNVNQGIRLRHFWGRINWLHDESGGSLNALLGGRTFRICYEPSGKPKLKFELTNARYRQIYLPAYEAANYALDLQGRCGFFLYKLGDDEFNRWLKGGPYSGIVVVVMKLSVKFLTGFVPAPPAWVTGTAYAESACVQRNGKSWVCTVAHTSAASFATDSANWVEISTAQPSWNWVPGTNFDPGEWVIMGGESYRCLDNHVAGSFATDLAADKWVECGVDKAAWAPETVYAKTDLVQHRGSSYVCVAGHTSKGFDADSDKFTRSDYRADWAAGAAYVALEIVKKGGQYYRATTDHVADASFAVDELAGNWRQVTHVVGWTYGSFTAGKILFHDADFYHCDTTHNSSGFDQDLTAGKWVKATTNKGDYKGGTAYVKTNWVKYKNVNYVCWIGHTSGSFAQDVTAGHWIKTNSKYNKWSDAQKKDWTGDLTRDLDAMLEGPAGKFYYSCGTGDFRKVYVRMFVQWEVPKPTDAATAGTHFEITVTRDEMTWLTTTDHEIGAGSSCNNNTIIRYMFGKASDSKVTRSTDPKITDALTKADLAKLGEWIKSVAGGDYTAEDIV
jgi:hypothetical protein